MRGLASITSQQGSTHRSTAFTSISLRLWRGSRGSDVECRKAKHEKGDESELHFRCDAEVGIVGLCFCEVLLRGK